MAKWHLYLSSKPLEMAKNTTFMDYTSKFGKEILVAYVHDILFVVKMRISS